MKHAGSEEAFRRVDFTYVHELARLASRHRAGQFLLVSALGANRQSRVFYNRVKGEVEEAVRKLPFDGVHIFRPSLFLGDRRESRSGERLAILAGRALGFVFVGPLGRYRPIAARAVAAAMVRIAKDAARGVHVYESDRIRALAGWERPRVNRWGSHGSAQPTRARTSESHQNCGFASDMTTTPQSRTAAIEYRENQCARRRD
jgi:uncharacterized protein YbjT (DUF2867 family)